MQARSLKEPAARNLIINWGDSLPILLARCAACRPGNVCGPALNESLPMKNTQERWRLSEYERETGGRGARAWLRSSKRFLKQYGLQTDRRSVYVSRRMGAPLRTMLRLPSEIAILNNYTAMEFPRRRQSEVESISARLKPPKRVFSICCGCPRSRSLCRTCGSHANVQIGRASTSGEITALAEPSAAFNIAMRPSNNSGTNPGGNDDYCRIA